AESKMCAAGRDLRSHWRIPRCTAFLHGRTRAGGGARAHAVVTAGTWAGEESRRLSLREDEALLVGPQRRRRARAETPHADGHANAAASDGAQAVGTTARAEHEVTVAVHAEDARREAARVGGAPIGEEVAEPPVAPPARRRDGRADERTAHVRDHHGRVLLQRIEERGRDGRVLR